jgi:IclR family KDG regulon transcriptional repressor
VITSDNYHATTIQRAIDVLNLFRERQELTFTEILDRLKYNKATLFRVLHTLEQNRYLTRDQRGCYELGLGILLLGNQVSQAKQLRKVVVPYLKRLARQNNLTVHLAVVAGLDIVIIDQFAAPNNLKVEPRVGREAPAHCTALGKVLLAYSEPSVVEMIIDSHGMPRYTPNNIIARDDLLQELQRIRECGYALDDSEYDRQIRCLGVPLLNRDNKIEAAVSITGLTIELPDGPTIAAKARNIREICDEISKEIE